MSTSGKENNFNWFNRESRVGFELNQLKMKNAIKKMIANGDTEVKIDRENEDGSIVGSIPLSYIRISKPYKRTLSADQRKAVAERFRKSKKIKDKH